jgi:hypothetical protein
MTPLILYYLSQISSFVDDNKSFLQPTKQTPAPVAWAQVQSLIVLWELRYRLILPNKYLRL